MQLKSETITEIKQIKRGELDDYHHAFIDDRNVITMEAYLLIALECWKEASTDDADLINTFTEIAAWLEEKAND